jgi:hypothetical protein
MTDRKVRGFIEGVGLVAVVVSVLFLAMQVRQANQIARAETSREIIALFNEFHDVVLSEPEVAQLLVALTSASPELTPTQAVQARHLATRFVNAYNSVHDAHVEGLANDEMHDAYAASIVAYMEEYPGLAPYLRDRAAMLPGVGERPLFAPLFEGT